MANFDVLNKNLSSQSKPKPRRKLRKIMEKTLTLKLRAYFSLDRDILFLKFLSHNLSFWKEVSSFLVIKLSFSFKPLFCFIVRYYCSPTSSIADALKAYDSSFKVRSLFVVVV